ncbi:hypothetical protein M9H77_02444 [Catharanthus roseus]|uniref:Uncharacterized protein n=1 Tax=Catharanthus roseus TaxID=4058 RepID=A0ACC0C8F1_CATRO|nr:hypothetical protein M9H77_02444 [Catharanthus roseus]
MLPASRCLGIRISHHLAGGVKEGVWRGKVESELLVKGQILRADQASSQHAGVFFCNFALEYEDNWFRRTQHLRHIRDRPDQFTVLVREIPICIEHRTHGCSVQHFFSKYHPHSYQCYQILYDSRELERLLVRIHSATFSIEF